MNQIIHWVNNLKRQALIGLMAGLLFMFSMVFAQNASAQSWISRHTDPPASSPTSAPTKNIEPSKTSTSIPVTLSTEEAPNPSEDLTSSLTNPVAPEIPNPYQKLLTKTQTSFEQALVKVNQAIADLPQQLEQVSTETQSSVRKRIKDELENKQDDLENVADKIDDLAEKLESFNSKLQKSIQQANVSDKFQQNSQNAQLSLENTAKAINDLADDVERAKKSSTPAFRSLIGEEITDVNQSLEAATKAIKAFVENPV